MGRHATSAWLISALLGMGAPSAIAQSNAQPTQQGHAIAATLSDAAYERYTAGDFEGSIELFEQAIAFDPHPVLRFNYARTLEELDKLPTALGIYLQLEREGRVPRVVRAAVARRELIEMRLMQEGYNPDTVTEETYRPRAPIVVRTGIPNARVFVDGRRVGEGEEVHFEWRAGGRQLFVWADGWYPYQGDVVFQQEGSAFDITLRERTSLTDYVPPPPGLLTIVGPVSGMAVYVDGVLQEKLTPARELLVHEGTYDIVVRHPLYDDWHARVAVIAGEETRIATENLFNGAPAQTLIARQKAGNALMGIGAAAIAGGVVSGTLALRASNAYNDNPNDPNRYRDRDRARNLARVADASFIAGGALATTGLIMRLVRPKESETVYEQELFDFRPGTEGTPFGATFTFRR